MNPLTALRRIHPVEQALILLCVELAPTAAFDLLDRPDRASVYGMFLIGGLMPVCIWSGIALRLTIKRAQAFARRADELARAGKRDELAEHLKKWRAWIDKGKGNK